MFRAFILLILFVSPLRAQFDIPDLPDTCETPLECPLSDPICFQGICVCFSPDSRVETQARGSVPMSELTVDDQVLTANGSFSKVYGFHHRTPASAAPTPSEFVRIKVESGEEITMTPRHMVFLATQSFPVEASQVKPGDYMIVQKQDAKSVSSQVVTVTPVEVRGGYSPLTMDGTIVVDGVVASCYANPSYARSDEYVRIAGVPVVHRHLFTHVLFSPARLYCKYISDGPCQATSSTSAETKITGDAWAHEMYLLAVEWGMLDLGLVLAGGLAGVFYGLECIISEWALTMAAVAVVVVVVGRKWHFRAQVKK